MLGFDRVPVEGRIHVRIAIPEFKGKIAPTFDFSRRLLVLDFFDGRFSGISPMDLSLVKGPARVDFLKEHQVEVLLCGSISQDLATGIGECGIRVISELSGEIKQVMKDLAANVSADTDPFPAAFKERKGQAGITAGFQSEKTQPKNLFYSRILGVGKSFFGRAKRILLNLTFSRR